MNNQTYEAVRILPKKLMIFSDNTLNRVASFIVSLKISPNTLSFLALFSGIGAGVFFFLKQPFWAGVSIVLCGVLDVLDGKVAARTRQKSLFGAIFDSTLDRYSEFFIYFGLALYFINHWALWLTFFTFFSSTMVSYTRARAEGLGIDCKIGVMQRAERIVLLSLGSLVGPLFKVFDPAIIGVLGTITLASNFTALQRIFHVKKVEKQNKLGKAT